MLFVVFLCTSFYFVHLLLEIENLIARASAVVFCLKEQLCWNVVFMSFMAADNVGRPSQHHVSRQCWPVCRGSRRDGRLSVHR